LRIRSLAALFADEALRAANLLQELRIDSRSKLATSTHLTPPFDVQRFATGRVSLMLKYTCAYPFTKRGCTVVIATELIVPGLRYGQ